MNNYNVHKAHCFRIVQPENEFMGCKYGEDEDCPIYPERDMLNKWAIVHDDVVTITAFMEWYDGLDEIKKARTHTHDLICEYFEIDQNKLEAQRRKLLENL